jgi:hypothetical protein
MDSFTLTDLTAKQTKHTKKFTKLTHCQKFADRQIGAQLFPDKTFYQAQGQNYETRQSTKDAVHYLLENMRVESGRVSVLTNSLPV